VSVVFAMEPSMRAAAIRFGPRRSGARYRANDMNRIGTNAAEPTAFMGEIWVRRSAGGLALAKGAG
jgi:hypothetical protein